MRSTSASSHTTRYLLDLNALIAVADPDSVWHGAIHRWYNDGGRGDWGVCPLTEAGFIRVTTNPKYRGADRTIKQAAAILAEFSTTKGYRYWEIRDSWTELTAPFSGRITGHQQVSDAYLLGLAIRENGVLVTFDSKTAYLAGTEFRKHLLTLL